MSEINLERDSGNSSPTSEMAVNVIKPTKDTEFVRTGDDVVDLKNFVEMHKIGPLEIDSKFVKTKQNRLFTCKIKVDKLIFSSYPKEFKDALSAEKFCAELALTELISKHGRRKSLLLSSDKDILGRIPPMLEKHHHGIWMWQLALDYADKYNEELPVDWLKIIDSSPCIQIEKCLDSCVLRHCKPGDVLQKGQKRNIPMALMDVSIPTNTVQFGADGKLFAEVTCVMSANEIWCRQYSTEESDIYSEMIGRMETFYNLNESTLKIETITEAGYYIAKYDNTWYRIRAVAVYDTEVHCFFIDYGDEMAIPKSNIYHLKREFALSQAQAFVCHLVGLEELYEASANSEILQGILYKQVILEMAVDNIVDENATNTSIPVFMYEFTTGNSINQELIPLLTIESASPIIQKEKITEVYPTYVESNGDVYVHLHSYGYDNLLNLLQNLESQILTNPPTNLISPVTKQNSEGKIYFAKYKVDGHWYRIQIIDWSPNEDLAQIYFVDYGNTDVINVTEDILYPLDKLSDVLSQYPFQAVKVRMTLDKIPDNFVALAGKAMPDGQSVLLKVVDYDDENVPWVEFFRSSEGGLFCINKSIAMEAEMKCAIGGTLQRPTLPKKGEYFEVHVPFAVNPYNFFVQPLESRTKLHRMMEQLQERYKDVLYSPLIVDQIEPGNIYASKHEDGYWYRTSVIKISKPKQSKWTMEDCEDFKALVEKKHFYSILLDIEKDELYESDIVLKLILIDTSADEDVYVGKELIKKDIAVEA
ncbi:hypothetical protein NQ314_007059 [Rhamnusium bicolor]|uniref:Tudor domain-containing protein n=1 Tax=Rhamnusium bicolor TaxID=1586634 RepID=A0AAV8YT37_9CUCU|nr:hypothetical protein NQ314_007059 [Rhamnusium bicolor]